MKPIKRKKDIIHGRQAGKRRKEVPPCALGKIIMMLKDFRAEWKRSNSYNAARMCKTEIGKLFLIRLGWNSTIFNELFPFILRHRLRKMVLHSIGNFNHNSFQRDLEYFRSRSSFNCFWHLADGRVWKEPIQSSAELGHVPNNYFATLRFDAATLKIEDLASKSLQKKTMHSRSAPNRKLFTK